MGIKGISPDENIGNLCPTDNSEIFSPNDVL